MFRFAVATVLAAFACLTAPTLRAEGVATCGSASAEGLGLFYCTSAWSYRAVAELSADTLVLTCRQNLTPGPQNMANCAYANETRYVRRSALTGSELIGYCAQPVHTPWEVCDHPSGKEGWIRASDVLTPSSTPPPSGNSVTISWSPVTSSTDGAPATISSYRIEYGQGNFATVANTTASSITFTGLASGTWQFRVVAVSSGGSSVPSQPVTRSISSSSTSPPPPSGTAPWTVAPNGSSNTRSVHEAVLASAGTTLVRGNAEGTISIGRTCGSEVFKIGTDSYRDVTEAEVTLSSPTYAGRRHVAVCIQQP